MERMLMRTALCQDTPILSFDILADAPAALKRTPWVGLFELAAAFLSPGSSCGRRCRDTLARFIHLTFSPA